MTSALVVNIALMYAILVGANLPAPLLGLEFPENERRLWYEPPGYVIVIAWFVLFGLLGVARFDLMQKGSSGELQWAVVGLAALCATYAYYTLGLARLTGLSPLWFGLVGNVAVILFALTVAYKISGVSPTGSKLVLPVAVWTTYATAIVLGQMRREGLV